MALPTVNLSSVSTAHIRPLRLSAGLTVARSMANRSYAVYGLTGSGNSRTLTNVRSRPGRSTVDSGEKSADAVDAFTLTSLSSWSITNSSFAWASDENVNDTAGTGNVFDRCIFAEGLVNTGHPSSPSDNHGAGLIIVGKDSVGDYTPVQCKRSLFVNNAIRSPEVFAATGTSDGQLCAIIANNVSFNPGEVCYRFDRNDWASLGTRTMKVDFVGNLLIPGSDSDLDSIAQKIQQANYSGVYYADNYIWINGAWTDLSAWAAARTSTSELAWKSTSNYSPTYESDPDTVYADVLQNAGAMPRDQWDQQFVLDVVTQNAKLPSYPAKSYLQPGNTPDIATGMVHRWTFNTDGSDGVGGVSVTLQGGETFAAAVVGNGMTMPSGESDEPITADTDAADFEASDDFTIAFWYKASALPVGSMDVLLKKASRSSDANAGWSFYVTGGSADRIAFNMADGTDGAFVLSAVGTLVANTWIHIAASVNRTDNILTLYINGLPVADYESGDALSSVGDLGNTLGIEFGDTAQSLNQSFNDVRIYGRCLTHDDVLAVAGFRNGATSIYPSQAEAA